MKNIIKKLLREGLDIINKTKDIFDDITDEKIGEENYESWRYGDEIGGTAFGDFKIINDIKVAYIIGMKSQPDGVTGDTFKRRGFFRDLIKNLKNNDVESIVIRLQSSDTRKALSRLVNDGTLINPREMTGVSVDLHPTWFDIN